MFKFKSFNIRAKVFTGYLLVIVCLGLALLIISGRMTSLQAEVDFVSTHDIEVHDLLGQIQKNTLDMETGMRGFIISGDESYLEPYVEGSRQWIDDYNKLRQLIADNQAQSDSLELIKTSIENWSKNAGEYAIQLKRDKNEAGLAQYYSQNRGKNIMDQLRTQFDSFLRSEKLLTNQRIVKLDEANRNLKIVLFTIVAIVSAIALMTGMYLSNSIVRTVRQVVQTMQGISGADGQLGTRIEVNSNDEIKELAEATNSLLENLEHRRWVEQNITEVTTLYQGITDVSALGQAFASKLAPLLGAVYGVVYLRKQTGSEVRYVRIAGYAASGQDHAAASFLLGEGLVGQCAADKRMFLVTNLPDDHIRVTSGLGFSQPRSLLVAPITAEGKVEAVVEFASLEVFQSHHLTLLDQLQEKFGSAINSVLGRMEIERLLGESQMMTEELQTQSEELQAQSEELQMQQEQLRITNEFLEEQNHFSEQKARELKKAKDELEEFSAKLQMSSQYKSDFLANMSHELRTPLNSILILSQMLMENNAEMQMSEIEEYSRVVNAAGRDLLTLIDDILDLSKVEAGKIEIMVDDVNVTEIPQSMKAIFGPVADKKGLNFEVIMEPGVPDLISTDGQRLQQILKNLLSNAFKFTQDGSVTMRIAAAGADRVEELLTVGRDTPVLAISITDTGIGIPIDKQQIIFEAFRQVDGTTNRQYGGTGLGLSICREFTRLLNGAIVVRSEVGKGSTFTLYVPCIKQPEQEETGKSGLRPETAGTDVVAQWEHAVAHERAVEEQAAGKSVEEPKDSEVQSDAQIFEGKKILLVEDDARNVYALVSAFELKGVKVQVAQHGEHALELLKAQPNFDLVLMDIMMPIMDGYETMKIIRHGLLLRDLPIIALTAKAMKSEREKCMEAGASDYIMKPIQMDQLFSLMRVWLTKQVRH
ncbi:CHASE3 domain-containing protein [Paenibacillus athensensis]|uniref:Circadian input-output histidine kinase CikA n=1 Tax=Paenibacillus athensensis TaxID=1967502 RepID=A0A4Y8PYI2_9BACL|nr:CHASE3 domain-containing protein [Paenibacillus athensensis]MCD1261202.1 CHASE3 domain-containing protein [Paenibacillus athensensis]